MRLPRLVVLPAVAALVAAGVAAPTVAHAATPGALTLPAVTPLFARSATVLGVTAPSERVDFAVSVAGRDDAALATLAEAVSDPASPQFRHFLTTAQREARFDPETASTTTVVTALKALGFAVDQVSPDGRLVDVHGTVAQVTAAFGVLFKDVRGPRGETLRTAMTQPLLPAVLRPLVSDITGLSVVPAKNFLADDSGPIGVTNNPATVYLNGRPCSAYYGEQPAVAQPAYHGIHPPYTICGYDAGQIRAAYRVPQTGLDGSGVHIGIVDDYSSPTMVADANEYANRHGIPPLAPGQYVDHSLPGASAPPEVTVTEPTGEVGALPVESPQEWSGEQSLDVEMVHVMAPKATIDYYGGLQGLGLQPLEEEFVNAMGDASAQFVSDSWGAYEGDLIVTPADFQLMATALQTGAVLGIGASFSSGDDGDEVEDSGVRQADFPASTDLATAVGGTTLVVGKNDTYVGETYWGTRLEPLTKDGKGWDATPTSAPFASGPPQGPGMTAGAAGGGISGHYAEPGWQKNVVPASLTTQSGAESDGNPISTPGRVVPDISLVGDSTTGVLVGQTQTLKDGKTQQYSEFRIGGTSVSSPLFAGLIALAIQKNGGASLGFVSPSMYAAYPLSPAAFRDPSLGRALTNVRTDYNDTSDPNSGVKYALRLLGQLGTLHDLRGYDDSTGLGTPCASAFVLAVVHPSTPAGSSPGCGTTGTPAGSTGPTTAQVPAPASGARPQPTVRPAGVRVLAYTGMSTSGPLAALGLLAAGAAALGVRRRRLFGSTGRSGDATGTA
ncbi:MAG: S53 family peptidase [Mycobacteriales bacterium]